MIEHQFGDVAVHVVQSPSVRFFRADFLVLEFGVLSKPSVVAHFAGIITPGISCLRSSTAGVFPLGFSGQSVKMSGLRAEPLAELVRCMLGDTDGGKLFGVTITHREMHRHVRWSGLSDGID